MWSKSVGQATSVEEKDRRWFGWWLLCGLMVVTGRMLEKRRGVGQRLVNDGYEWEWSGIVIEIGTYQGVSVGGSVAPERKGGRKGVT